MKIGKFKKNPTMATGKYSFLSKKGEVRSFTKKHFAVDIATEDGATTVYSPTGKIVWTRGA